MKTKRIPTLDADFAVNISRTFLRCIGVWPNTECSQVYKIVSKLVFFSSLILIIYFIVIAQTTKLFLIKGNLDVIVDILCTADIPVFIAVIKMTMIRYDAQVIKELLDKISDDWKTSHTNEENEKMMKSAKLGRKVSITCISLAYGTSSIFLFLRLILLREKQARTGERSFLFDSYFPFDSSGSPWFEIIWLLQGFCTFSATTAYASIDGLFAVLVLHLCGQLTLLQTKLNNLTTQNDKKSFRENIAEIVERHNELNWFAETIEKTFNRMFLAQILACLLQFCLQEYQLISIVTDVGIDFPIFQITFMVSYLFYMSIDLFIYCYVAEKLLKKSLDLSDAVYNCKWYELKSTEALDLICIIKRAQDPLKITAGKFSCLSLKLFCKIGQTSLGYLSVLLAIKDRTRNAI